MPSTTKGIFIKIIKEFILLIVLNKSTLPLNEATSANAGEKYGAPKTKKMNKNPKFIKLVIGKNICKVKLISKSKSTAIKTANHINIKLRFV